MFMHVTEARYLADYRIWLAFNDGAAGEVDLAPELYGDLFEPLKDPARFRAFRLEGHTLAWENGADFAPEFLRGQVVEQVNAA